MAAEAIPPEAAVAIPPEAAVAVEAVVVEAVGILLEEENTSEVEVEAEASALLVEVVGKEAVDMGVDLTPLLKRRRLLPLAHGKL